MTVELDITEPLPADLGGRVEALNATYRVSRDRFDVSIGGLPFLLGNSHERPYRRQSAPIRKEQVDTQATTGEQSLDGWWLRSQTDFSGGAGITYYEPLLGSGSGTRFLESEGVNVFDHDDVRLLNRMDQVLTGGTDVELVGLGEVTALYRNGTSFHRINASGGTSTVTPTGNNPKGIARIPGHQWLIGHDTGIGRLTSTGVASAVVTGATAPLRPFWVKDRIIATQNHKLFQLTLAGGSINESDDLLYAHPSTQWRWVGVVETGSAIWAAGRADFASAIYVTSVQDVEGVPTLATPKVAVQLPAGEYVTALGAYLDMLLVGTNLGFRIAVTSGDRAELGPLLWRDEPVFSVGARGDFAWVGLANGKTRRVDLGNDLTGGLLFAWANDAATTGGNVLGIAFAGNTLILASADGGAFVQGSQLVDSGYLRTGFMRMGTWENKAFHAVKVVADASNGTISIGSATRPGNFSGLTSLGSFNGSTEANLNLQGTSAWEMLSLQITLERGGPTQGPRLEGYQIRALPAPQRSQRLLQIVLQCFDKEQNSDGLSAGGPGYAFKRLQLLEEMEARRLPVVFQDFRTGEALLVQIEQTDFVNAAPPDRNQPNFSGFLTVVLRTVS